MRWYVCIRWTRAALRVVYYCTLNLTQKTAKNRAFHRRIALIEVYTGRRKGGGQLSSEFAPLIREIGQNRGVERVEQLELRVLAFVCLLIENKLVPRSPVSVSAPRRVRAIKVQKCPGWVLCGGVWWEEGKRSIPLHIAWCVLSVWGRLKKKYGRRHPPGLVGEGEY